MSLYRIDGWDYYPPNSTGQTVVGPNFMADGYTNGLNNWTTYPGRFGGNCVSLGSNFNSFQAIGHRYTDSDTVIIGHAFNMDSQILITGGQIGVYDAEGASYLQCGVSFEQNGVFRAFRGTGGSGSNAGTIVATSHSGVYHPQEWNYLEVKIKVHATAGLIEVRLNTVTIISYVGPTTNQFNNPILSLAHGWDNVAYLGFSNLKWDDRYILLCDGIGNADYLGNVRVNTQLTVGAGDLTQFGVVGAAANWNAVNEFVLTDAEYVWTQTIGNEDLYSMDPIITAANIFGMQVTGAHKQDDATQKTSRNLIKTHSTVYEGADNVLAQTYRYYHDVFELNPNTGVGWTASELNAAQAGQKLQA